eukprot:GHVR01139744.1.p1 GENE.GHVR01139744.1~~GHVR01139744.1.p1  ORF type:complete len:103 (+),score=56.03 GHVR01139744.1:48-356(+)
MDKIDKDTHMNWNNRQNKGNNNNNNNNNNMSITNGLRVIFYDMIDLLYININIFTGTVYKTYSLLKGNRVEPDPLVDIMDNQTSPGSEVHHTHTHTHTHTYI